MQPFSSCRCGTPVVPPLHWIGTANGRDAQRRRGVVARQALGLKDAPSAEDATEVRRTVGREEFGLSTKQLQKMVEAGENNPYSRGVVERLDQLLNSLRTCKEQGLCHKDKEDLQSRVQTFGANSLPERSEVFFNHQLPFGPSVPCFLSQPVCPSLGQCRCAALGASDPIRFFKREAMTLEITMEKETLNAS